LLGTTRALLPTALPPCSLPPPPPSTHTGVSQHQHPPPPFFLHAYSHLTHTTPPPAPPLHPLLTPPHRPRRNQQQQQHQPRQRQQQQQYPRRGRQAQQMTRTPSCPNPQTTTRYATRCQFSTPHNLFYLGLYCQLCCAQRAQLAPPVTRVLLRDLTQSTQQG
jgi:hypothetical protein